MLLASPYSNYCLDFAYLHFLTLPSCIRSPKPLDWCQIMFIKPSNQCICFSFLTTDIKARFKGRQLWGFSGFLGSVRILSSSLEFRRVKFLRLRAVIRHHRQRRHDSLRSLWEAPPKGLRPCSCQIVTFWMWSWKKKKKKKKVKKRKNRV